MDAKGEINRLWKDLQASAREVASFGLQVSSKALDVTSGALSTLRDEVNKKADKIANKNGGEQQK